MITLLSERLRRYQSANALQEEQALKEILQELALYALWRADFFNVAVFHGGTSLRILHGLPRFSEDLDFLLLEPDNNFQWSHYFATITDIMGEFGVRCELTGNMRMDKAVRQAMLKNDSIGRQLNLSFFDSPSTKKLRIKLEIDTNPPAGTGITWHYLDFPLDFEVCAQDLPSNFALKLHALLCRPYIKGRDWYDFAWYCSQQTRPNLTLFANAIAQSGPWACQGLPIDHAWLISTLRTKIREIDWNKAAMDVAPFIGQNEQASLKLWSQRFFEGKMEKLNAGLNTGDVGERRN